jgi:ABC-type branched-subunit amino acid transport system ATPase component
VGLAPRAIWRRMGVGRTFFRPAATWASMTVAENVQVALLSHALVGSRPLRACERDVPVTRRWRCSMRVGLAAMAEQYVTEPGTRLTYFLVFFFFFFWTRKRF